MSSADRLSELRRQRASIAEHLAWLDREIAAAAAGNGGTGKTEPRDGTAKVTSPSPAAAPIAPVVTGADTPNTGTALEQEADAILEEHRVGPGDIQRDVRRGCFLYFAGALVAVAVIIAVLYLALKR